MPKRFRGGLVVVCEHIVQGLGNKPTFVGVYTGDILISEMPASFWIAFFVEIRPTKFPSDMRISLRLNNEEFGGVPLDTTSLVDGAPLLLTIPTGTLTVEQAAELTVIISGAGFEDFEAVRKSVIKSDVALTA